ncbi:MAG: mannonate dehydratase [Calditrichaceae bacterium]|nr:mannonate dehydratase [Calditrichaceae bacterium]HES59046.1 mannonate dehydratase [Caldithrix sp.]
MALEQTWRWFGPKDPISLKEVKQTGATGVVNALHQIPIGTTWTIDEIKQRKAMIEIEGLTWSVVESVPVHEDIKKRTGSFKKYIDNYKKTIAHLGKCGVDRVCYNFMPVLDWSRTDLKVEFKDGSITTKFDANVFAAFDLYILERPNAAESYNQKQIDQAKVYYDSLSESQKEKLTETILLGFPGSLEAYSMESFKAAINEYQFFSKKQLQDNLQIFIKEIVPVAEESGILLAIHPDDPPWSLLGLPRIVSTADDLDKILRTVDSPVNGITLCTGSLGAGINNDLIDITNKFVKRINFIHLRNLTRNIDGDFMEDHHLNGEIDLYTIMKTLLLEQKRRAESNEINARMPMRPDHGHLTLADANREGIYPGYSLFGRMRGLAELRGLELGILRSLNV